MSHLSPNAHVKGQCRQGIALQQMCNTNLFPRNLCEKHLPERKTRWDNIYRARGQREQRSLLEHDCLCCLLHTDTQTQEGRLTHKPGGFFSHCLLHVSLPSASFLYPPPHPPFLQLRRRAFDVTGCYYLTQLCRAPTAPPNRQMLFYPTFEELMRQWVKQTVITDRKRRKHYGCTWIRGLL